MSMAMMPHSRNAFRKMDFSKFNNAGGNGNSPNLTMPGA
jgi:hypothetical protein